MARAKAISVFALVVLLACAHESTGGDFTINDICLDSGSTHLAQIALDHTFDGTYLLAVHRADETVACSFEAQAGCPRDGDCKFALRSPQSDLAKVRVANAECEMPTSVKWRDDAPPWKVLLGRKSSAPVRLVVSNQHEQLLDAEIHLTFPGADECDFSPYATSPPF